MPSALPCALVIYGASGDLANRKLIPAIYEQFTEAIQKAAAAGGDGW